MHRLLIRVSGAVQGVGFRPFAHELAMSCGLAGFVRNDGDGVHIELEGEPNAIQRFQAELATQSFARIATIHTEAIPLRGERTFRIEASHKPAGSLSHIPADSATCAECLRELFSPTDRRYRYPFISCVRCGPRFTVITELPYDRARTTMSAFPLCADCQREFDDPANRRFHAQTTACPVCGPRLSLLDAAGSPLLTSDPLGATVAALQSGSIVAIKGLGGFHLACDARSAEVVTELRRRKHRDEKPLAVMVADIESANLLAEIAPREAELLQSAERPIVLLRCRSETPLAEAIAPGNPCIGLMLPYTPLHHLLLRDFSAPLVMTSGNRTDEPIACEDTDAVRRLAGIADLFLTHTRAIRSRCDDSVMRVVSGSVLPVRRSRGYAPPPLPLPFSCPRSILATGGQLKTVFALGRDSHAILSHHIGDLEGYETFHAFTEAISDYERLFRFRPDVIAHDLHPDYASTRYALERGVKLVAVQHHYAHMAACMAENGLGESVIGVTFDGTGYGLDGTIWGGEFLVGDYRAFQRAAHLRAVPLPGGDRAILEPWRSALSQLLDAHQNTDVLARIEPDALRTVRAMIERGVNSPLTSSAGRLFDALAAIIGLRNRVSYEGQAAIELEGLATQVKPDSCYPFEIMTPRELLEVDTRSLIGAVVEDVRRGVPQAVIARRFHSTLVAVIATVCNTIRDNTGLNAVILSGGVFLNAILLAETLDRLTRDGFRTYHHTHVPPGDGGLCLVQLVVAAALDS